MFREKVLNELKVSDDQREKLMQLLMERIMQTGPFLDSLTETGPEREKKLSEHRKDAQEKLAKNLKDVLQPDQQKRLRQVTLQQEGSFALGQDDVRKELKITQEQMKQFMAITQELQRKVESLVKQAQSGGNPDEIRPKIEQLRKDEAKKLEAALTDAQKKQWKELSAHRSSWKIDRGIFHSRLRTQVRDDHRESQRRNHTTPLSRRFRRGGACRFVPVEHQFLCLRLISTGSLGWDRRPTSRSIR